MLDAPYDPTTIDRAAQDLWERLGVFRFEPGSTAEVFSIDTPPPTVSGNLHIGHVFSYTQAECIARYQRMRGKNVFYPFGFDGNGLPTERLAEQEHGVKGKDLPRPEFVRLCLETSRKYASAFEAFMRSLGLSADWSLAYSTIDERSMRVSQRAFLDLWAKGEAYLKESPTLWCTQCGTALAQADVEFKDKPAQFTTLRFDLVGGGSLEIATTRPELLSACAAVFVHPTHARAAELVGRRALVPLQDGRDVPVLADERVDPEKGTGLVMCCTFGDKTDVEWFQKHGLPLRQAIKPDGTLDAIAGPEAGLYVNKGRRAILERLGAAGHVTASREITHPVATHERCKTDIQFLPTRQVFVRVLDKKAELVAQGEKVRWLPEYMGKRYRNWVENLEWDWCISRQRFYGVPFPLWHCRGCRGVVLARDADLPVDPTASPPPGPCPACGGADLEPERDVMDTWATSSETPQINARWGESDAGPRAPRPMSMRPQAHEIIRTWAFYTIAKSWLHFRDLPWRDAMISGLVLDANREKISKSKGNAPADPKDVLAKHGADAVRYWALSAKLGTDYPTSEDDLAAGRRLGVKLWNAARLAAQHLVDFDPRAPRAEPQTADRWIRARLHAAVRAVTDDLEVYEFGTAKVKVEQAFWNDLCDNYLELVKGRLNDRRPEAGAARQAAQAGLYDALRTMLGLFAPFVPHVAEVLWQALFAAHEGQASLARAPWPAPPDAWADAAAAAQGAAAVAVLTAVRRWRSENKLSPGVPLARAHLKAGAGAAAEWRPLAGDVKAALRVAELTVEDDAALGTDAVIVASVTTAQGPA
jgi:valyl-tRNA synthetase